jgi:DNA repair exonuclease SbcCD ATPase subunit
MPGQCPLCGQSLPEAINEKELEARIEKLASPALAIEKKKLKEEFETQLVAEREMATASVAKVRNVQQ